LEPPAKTYTLRDGILETETDHGKAEEVVIVVINYRLKKPKKWEKSGATAIYLDSTRKDQKTQPIQPVVALGHRLFEVEGKPIPKTDSYQQLLSTAFPQSRESSEKLPSWMQLPTPGGMIYYRGREIHYSVNEYGTYDYVLGLPILWKKATGDLKKSKEPQSTLGRGVSGPDRSTTTHSTEQGSLPTARDLVVLDGLPQHAPERYQDIRLQLKGDLLLVEHYEHEHEHNLVYDTRKKSLLLSIEDAIATTFWPN
jgi:hypothetical protein